MPPDFIHPIEQLVLPPSLRILRLYPYYYCGLPLTALRLPSTLRELHLPILTIPATGLILPPSLRAFTYSHNSDIPDPFIHVIIPHDVEIIRLILGN